MIGQSFAKKFLKIEEATESYLMNLRVENRSPKTVYWYRDIFDILNAWCQANGIYTLDQVDTDLSYRHSNGTILKVVGLHNHTIRLDQMKGGFSQRNCPLEL